MAVTKEQFDTALQQKGITAEQYAKSSNFQALDKAKQENFYNMYGNLRPTTTTTPAPARTSADNTYLPANQQATPVQQPKPAQPTTTPQGQVPVKFEQASVPEAQKNTKYYEQRDQQIANQIVTDLTKTNKLGNLNEGNADALVKKYIQQYGGDLQGNMQDWANTQNRIKGYLMTQKTSQLLGKYSNGSDVYNDYNNGKLNDNDIAQLKGINPEVAKQFDIEKTNKESTNMVNGMFGLSTATEEKPQDDLSKIMSSIQSAIGTTTQINLKDLYASKTTNNPDYQAAMTDMNAKKKALQEQKDLMDNKLAEVRKRYAGTGATEGYIRALAAKEQEDMTEQYERAVRDYEEATNNFNGLKETVNQEMEFEVKQYEMDQQQQQEKMKELGFAYDIYKDQRDYQYKLGEEDRKLESLKAQWKAQEEFVKGNIDSKDPTEFNKAVEYGVKQYTDPLIQAGWQFKDVQAGIKDIETGLKNGTYKTLEEAITKRFVEPTNANPDFKTWQNKKLGLNESGDKVQYLADGVFAVTDKNGKTTYKTTKSIMGIGESGLSTGSTLSGYLGGIGNGKVSSWGSTSNPNGIDISGAGAVGSPITAFKEGKVVYAKADDGGWGNSIAVQYNDDGKGNGYIVRYSHLKDMNVKVGDTVSGNTTIGTLGGVPGMPGAGTSTGAHVDITSYSSIENFVKRKSNSLDDTAGYLSDYTNFGKELTTKQLELLQISKDPIGMSKKAAGDNNELQTELENQATRFKTALTTKLGGYNKFSKILIDNWSTTASNEEYTVKMTQLLNSALQNDLNGVQSTMQSLVLKNDYLRKAWTDYGTVDKSLNIISDDIAQLAKLKPEQKDAISRIKAATMEDYANKLGALNIPELSKLSADLKLFGQSYVLKIAGTSFTDSLLDTLMNTVPKSINSPELNRIIVKSFKDKINGDFKTTFVDPLGGRDNYNLIFNKGITEQSLNKNIYETLLPKKTGTTTKSSSTGVPGIGTPTPFKM